MVRFMNVQDNFKPNQKKKSVRIVSANQKKSRFNQGKLIHANGTI